MNLAPLLESEREQAGAILDAAFADMHRALFGRTPPGRPEGLRVRSRFDRPDTLSVAIRDARDQLRGVCLVQVSGTYAVVGPLAVHPTHDQAGQTFQQVTRFLLAQTSATPIEIADTVTFPHSPLHLKGHWQAFDPLFPAPFLVRRLGRSRAAGPNTRNAGFQVARYGLLPELERSRARAGLAAICEDSQPGYDLTAEVEHVARRSLGDTWVLHARGEPIAFAVCHFGSAGESFMDEQCLIKNLHVIGGHPYAELAFHQLLDAIEHGACPGSRPGRDHDQYRPPGQPGRAVRTQLSHRAGARPLAARRAQL